jgi:hypothetical protein
VTEAAEKPPEPEIVRSHLNSYHYFYEDAEALRSLAESHPGTSEEIRFSRTAILLYVFSLEGLINRALETFLPSGLREYFLEREDRLSTADKWLLVPLLAGGRPNATFDRAAYPWYCFTDLISLRNDFVHPKHDRYAYHQWSPDGTIRRLRWEEIPRESSIRERDCVYRQIRVPKDPHALGASHAREVKKVVDDMVTELNRLLGGQIDENFLHDETLHPVYPPGAQFDFSKLRGG